MKKFTFSIVFCFALLSGAGSAKANDLYTFSRACRLADLPSGVLWAGLRFLSYIGLLANCLQTGTDVHT